jgi:antagonist of KipI
LTAPVLKVLNSGLFTLVVDAGRPHCRSLGLPVGGAADRAALALGNALVGNGAGAAALEITLAGPTLQSLGADLACVLHGAPFEATIDDRPLTVGKTFTLPADAVLRIGGATAGVRAYLCIQGGFQTPEVLGSRSAFAPLRAGDELPVLPGRTRARAFHHAFSWAADSNILHVLDARQTDWFPPDEFLHRTFRVAPASDRMGLRLQGPPLSVPQRELVSEPVCPGAVQVTPDGQCVVLGVDGQTIGGYPKVAQVVSADLDKLGQLRAGDPVHFRRISLERAESLYKERERELHAWTTRLRTAALDSFA